MVRVASAQRRPSVGGKCANLGELVSAGIPVPNGFAVTVEAFEAFEELNQLREHIRDGLIDQVDLTNSAALRQVQKEASALIHSGSMPERLEREIHEATPSCAAWPGEPTFRSQCVPRPWRRTVTHRALPGNRRPTCGWSERRTS